MHNSGNSQSASRNVYIFVQRHHGVFILWILFRVITSLSVAVVSRIRPITEIEQRIQIYPPSIPVADWLERVFISPWYRWDAEWYTRIILNGYSNNDGTTNFHPLFPWLGKILTTIGFDPVLSLIIISSIATILLIFTLNKLITLDLNQGNHFLTLFIFLIFPISFILFAPYPESLFLLFSVICFYSLRMRHWGIAGISASLAVLTRQQGLLLIFPYIWELWEASERRAKEMRLQWQSWLTIIYIPITYLLWIGYRIFIIGESILKTTNIQEIIYSIFISSSAKRIVPNQSFTWPWNTLYLGYDKLNSAPDLDIWINVLLSILFLCTIVVGWKFMTTSFRLYSLIIFFVSFSYFTGPIHPFMGLARHLLLAFPIFIGISPFLEKRRLILWVYVIFNSILMLILLTAYTLNAWVP